MAQQGLDVEQFSCSICLDVLKDPVTIPCGHSYCMGCIKHCWDQDDHKGIYSCPQCRETFTPRPVLKKNNMLAEVVEQLKKTGLQAAPPDHCYAGPGDVACDFCPGRKQKALKSCLVCLTSFCETHLQPHYTVAPLKKHKLVKASTRLQENTCSRHDRILDVFCRTDQQCICYLCSMDEHKGHDAVSAAAERTERQKELGVSQQKVQQRVQEREKKLKELRQAVDSLNGSADKAVEDSERIFTELIRSSETRRSEVKKVIRAQQRTTVTQAEELQKRLEQEIVDMRRRDTELEQLSHTEDHIHFLQSYPSLSSPSEATDLPSVSVLPLPYFADVTEAVSELRDKLEDVLKEQWPGISTTVNAVHVLLPPEPKTRADLSPKTRADLSPKTRAELSPKTRADFSPKTRADFSPKTRAHLSPKTRAHLSPKTRADLSPKTRADLSPKTRADFLQYSCQNTLDPNTVFKHLSLSEGNRKATWMQRVQSYPNHPERYIDYCQVLGRDGLTGRCYWEVQWSGGVAVAASYQDISRTGGSSLFGNNSKSWALCCASDGYVFRHNFKNIQVSCPRASRTGVYLDHRAGTLSFYSVSDTMTLLHRVNTTFTQPLYPGLHLWGDQAEFCDLK